MEKRTLPPARRKHAPLRSKVPNSHEELRLSEEQLTLVSTLISPVQSRMCTYHKTGSLHRLDIERKVCDECNVQH